MEADADGHAAVLRDVRVITVRVHNDVRECGVALVPHDDDETRVGNAVYPVVHKTQATMVRHAQDSATKVLPRTRSARRRHGAATNEAVSCGCITPTAPTT